MLSLTWPSSLMMSFSIISKGRLPGSKQPVKVVEEGGGEAGLRPELLWHAGSVRPPALCTQHFLFPVLQKALRGAHFRWAARFRGGQND